MSAYEIMFDALLLLGSRGGGSDFHTAIYLPTVAIQDWRAKRLGHLKRKFCLTDSRRAKQNKECHYSSIS